MDEATRLLSSPEISISAIARRLGYNNLQSFERFFKKSQAVSAKEYRRLLGNGQGARREGESQIRRSVSKPTVYNSNPDPS
jgi:AraC-like DNA-binding protein